MVFELGFFAGTLGRNHVVALNKGVEIPSDLAGVLYVEMDGDGWKFAVAMEMAAAGIDVDLNRLRRT